MQVFIHLDGDDNLIKKFESLANYLKSNRLRKILEQFRDQLVTWSKMFAPEGSTGNLRKAIWGRILGWGTDQPTIEVRVKNHIKYANAVHDGSPPHIIKPRNKQFLRWVDDSPDGQGGERLDWPPYVRPPAGFYEHFRRYVVHPGQKANPFMEKALNKVQGRLLMSILRDIEELNKERKG